jgi:hypothetical protein
LDGCYVHALFEFEKVDGFVNSSESKVWVVYVSTRSDEHKKRLLVR